MTQAIQNSDHPDRLDHIIGLMINLTLAAAGGAAFIVALTPLSWLPSPYAASIGAVLGIWLIVHQQRKGSSHAAVPSRQREP